MKYVILEKAQVKPYTRTRKGKLERVKGYPREATIWQIGKDYGVSKEEARKIYTEAEERKQARKEMSEAKTEGEVKEVIKKWGTALYRTPSVETRLAVTRGSLQATHDDPKMYRHFKEKERQLLEWRRERDKAVERLKKIGGGELPKGYTPELIDSLSLPVLKTLGIISQESWEQVERLSSRFEKPSKAWAVDTEEKEALKQKIKDLKILRWLPRGMRSGWKWQEFKEHLVGLEKEGKITKEERHEIYRMYFPPKSAEVMIRMEAFEKPSKRLLTLGEQMGVGSVWWKKHGSDFKLTPEQRKNVEEIHTGIERSLRNSYPEFDGFEDWNDGENKVYFSWSTRDDSPDGESPGEGDIKLVSGMIKKLRAEFGNKIKVSGETIDEWVNLNVEIPKEERLKEAFEKPSKKAEEGKWQTKGAIKERSDLPSWMQKYYRGVIDNEIQIRIPYGLAVTEANKAEVQKAIEWLKNNEAEWKYAGLWVFKAGFMTSRK